MSEQGALAFERFHKGYNCCQATLGAFCKELALTEDFAARIASGLGAGYGRQREVCGAVSAICMAAGVLYGYSAPDATDEKTATYEMIRDLCAAFKAQNGSILCRELLGLQGAEESAQALPRTAEYYAARPCAELCRCAADLLAAQIEAATQK